MGIQIMGSHGGGGGGGRQQSLNQRLARQGSIYSLTLDEVQSHLGEPLHSMNLDDFLKNVVHAEGNQSAEIDTAAGQHAHGVVLQQQGSISMPRTLRKKTVDEVWHDIQHKKTVGDSGEQSTFGEMTLEDFLVKAGLVTETRKNPVGNSGNSDNGMQDFGQGMNWLYQFEQRQQQNVMGTFVPLNRIMDGRYNEGQVTMQSPVVGRLSDTQTLGRKRVAVEELAEKTVERRQKRMIKNRESAARSRARKQAYTNELENKVSRLEEENERLRKQKRELDNMLHCAPPPDPKNRLRRTSSAPL